LRKITAGIERAEKIDIKDLRNVKRKSHENEILPFVSTHNPNNGNFFHIIAETQNLLLNDSAMANALKTSKIIASRRQSPSLKKLLTRASLNQNMGVVSHCTDKRCKTCPYMPIVSSLSFHSTGKVFYLRNEFTCTSRNLIYCITCKGCNKQYIGETGDILRNRMTLHRQQIREPKYCVLHVSEHIAKCAKRTPIQFEIIPFYKLALTTNY